jgi:DNA-binding NtrC family response regulator
LIEVAEDGTVFFDEIENASPSVQSKLLQLIEDRIYRKVGSVTYNKTNARFITATNMDLKNEVLNNNFRSDLYYRLAVLEIKIPALSERGRDILQIANFYIKKFSLETGKNITELGEKDYRQLSSYNWPGNVRELRNYIERAVIFSSGNKADLSVLPENPALSSENILNFNYKGYMKDKEIEFIKKALAKCNGNIEQTAKLMDMSVPFIYKKIREYNIKS